MTCGIGFGGDPRCDLLYTNDLLAALAAPPLEGYFRLEMKEDGAITGWRYEKGNQATTAAYLRPFSDWVSETDPDAAERMFDWNGFGFRNPEAYALWTAKAEEFLETLG